MPSQFYVIFAKVGQDMIKGLHFSEKVTIIIRRLGHKISPVN